MFSFIKSLFSKKAPQTPPQPHFPRGTRSAWAFKELERVTGPGEYLIRTPHDLPIEKAQAHVCKILTNRFGSKNYRTNRMFDNKSIRVIVR